MNDMISTEKENILLKLRECIVLNQFSRDDNLRGQFGTNTDFESRTKYRPNTKENVQLTPQLFLTYMGLLALKSLDHPEINKRLKWIKKFTLSCLIDNFAWLSPHFEEKSKINFRHSAMAHTILTDLGVSNNKEKDFIRYLIEKKIQLNSGGWPESAYKLDNESIVSTVYMVHFLFKFLMKYPKYKLANEIEEVIKKTLKYLISSHKDGLWHLRDDDATLRFYPTLYLLAFPVLLYFEGENCSIIKSYPSLITEKFKGDFISLRNKSKEFRASIRYLANLYFHKPFDKSIFGILNRLKMPIIENLSPHYFELNSHEILGLFLLIDEPKILNNDLFRIFFNREVISKNKILLTKKNRLYGIVQTLRDNLNDINLDKIIQDLSKIEFSQVFINSLEKEDIENLLHRLNKTGISCVERGDVKKSLEFFKLIIKINELYNNLIINRIWNNLEPGQILKMGLIQLDIEDHSGLVRIFNEKSISIGRIMQLKADFANLIEGGLRDLKIKKIFWAGDGGLYANRCENSQDYDNIIYASDRIYIYLQVINFLYKKELKISNRNLLKIRVSAHLAGEVWGHPNPEYWHSHHINFFVKNERNLSFAGAFSITDSLYLGLSKNTKSRFSSSNSSIIVEEKAYPEEKKVIKYYFDNQRELPPK